MTDLTARPSRLRRAALSTALAVAAAAAWALAPAPAAADTDTVTVSIKDHRFAPETVEVPAGKKIKLVIKNQDATPEEFESYDLNREKIIPGGTDGVVYIGPLDPGRYEFFGEFNPETARGWVVAE